MITGTYKGLKWVVGRRYAGRSGGNRKLPEETLAGDSGEYSTKLHFHERLRRYGKAHSRAADMGKYITELTKSNTILAHEFGGLATRLDLCGEFLVFRDYYTTDQVRLTHANFCKTTFFAPYVPSGELQSSRPSTWKGPR